jgi:hypothetical protein
MSGWDNRSVEELIASGEARRRPDGQVERVPQPDRGEWVTFQERVPREIYGRVQFTGEQISEIVRGQGTWQAAQVIDEPPHPVAWEALAQAIRERQAEQIQYIPYRNRPLEWLQSWKQWYAPEELIHPDLRVEDGL